MCRMFLLGAGEVLVLADGGPRLSMVGQACSYGQKSVQHNVGLLCSAILGLSCQLLQSGGLVAISISAARVYEAHSCIFDVQS